jgi:predicted transcriptional regulator
MIRGILMDLNHNLELYEEVKDDIKFISSSTVRTKIIISLTQGTTKLKDLKDEIEVDSSTILHAMKKLEDKNLIYKKRDEYFISQTGIICGFKLIDLINLLYEIKMDKEI